MRPDALPTPVVMYDVRRDALKMVITSFPNVLIINALFASPMCRSGIHERIKVFD